MERLRYYADMLRGPAFTAHLARSWAVGWPMVFIMALEFLINLTDVFIAGRLGKEVQAAVGFAMQLYFIFIVAANAITVGTVSVVSRIHAAGDGEGVRAASWSVIATCLGAGAALGVLGYALTPVVIGMVNLPAEVKRYAAPLVQVLALGLPFHYFNINASGIMRATDRVKRALATVMATCVINIGLNFLLVFHTPLGFLGIMVSTVGATVVGSLINAGFMAQILRAPRVFSRGLLGRILLVGWPSGVQQVMWHVGAAALFLILGALPNHNVEVIAAYTNGLRIEAAIFLSAFAFNMANAVIVGNFLGAHRQRDAFRGGLVTAGIGVAVVAALTIVVVVHAKPFAGFLSANAMVIDRCATYLYISMLSEPFMAWGVILAGALGGAGDTRGVMMIIVGSQWLVRLPLAFVLGIVLGLGEAAVWWSMNASIFVYCILLTRRYFKRKWLHL
ncbi:MAG TPA: MATE family efflux transporter [Spirochaetota bacterium]|nr:MATE family efflux transporter [Spirochaetota bacterium]HNT11884.1 MATE family efflux transporter [Spirochaetota bacterium]HOS38203.1 MATE family efflux transporter [Spirochaetota bacterium]HPI24094.1 MATE family efflux transporter [Spirochaetota bacterium]